MPPNKIKSNGHTVHYLIRPNKVPEIILDGIKLGIVNVSYQWYTMIESTWTKCLLIATCVYIKNDTIHHVDLVIDEALGEAYVNDYEES